MSDSVIEKNNPQNQESEQLPGERLRIAREKIGLSCEDVAVHLKLNAEKIHLIEQGDVSNLAAPVYVAGYLRAYAKLVGLPGEKIVADFSALSRMVTPSMDPSTSPASGNYGYVDSGRSARGSKKSQNRLSLMTVGLLIVLVIAAVAYFVIVDNRSQNNTAARSENKPFLSDLKDGTASSETENSDAIGGVDNKGIEQSSSMDGATVENDQTSDKRIDDADKQNSLALGLQNADVQKTEEESAKQDITSGDQKHSVLVFNFREDSWIEVSDASGKRLIYRLGKSGTTKTVWGIAPFSVRLGYMPGVDIRFNGNEFDLSEYGDRRKVLLKIGG